MYQQSSADQITARLRDLLRRRPFREWDEEDVGTWLSIVEMSKYRRAFKYHEIRGDVLHMLDHALLKEVGVKTVGERMRILMYIGNLSKVSAERLANEGQRADIVLAQPVTPQLTPPMTPTYLATPLSGGTEDTALISPNPFATAETSSSTKPPSILTSSGNNNNNTKIVDASFLTVDTSSARLGSPIATRTMSNSSKSPVQTAHSLTAESPRFSLFAPFKTFATFRNGKSKKRQESDGSSSKMIPEESSQGVNGQEAPPVIDVMSFESVRRLCIRVIGDEGQMHIINISNFTSGAEVMKRIYKKFHVDPTDKEFSYTLFVLRNGVPQSIDEDELWAICTDEPPRHERDQLILQRMHLCVEFRQSSMQASVNAKYQDLVHRYSLRNQANQPSGSDTSNSMDRNQKEPQRPNLVTDRPPREVISVNMDLFFPTMKLQQSTMPLGTTLHRVRRPRSQSVSERVFGGQRHRPSFNLSARPFSMLSLDVPNLLHTPVSSRPNSMLAVPGQQQGTEGMPRIKEHQPESYYDGSSLSPTSLSDRDEFDEDESQQPEISWLQGDIIGKGSFGTVYYGINCSDGSLMAVKQVQLPLTGDPSDAQNRRMDMFAALQSEIELLKALDHPNIVRYIGSSVDDYHLTLFLEYVSGGSVASILAKQGWISYDDSKYYIQQVVQGLEYLHGQGIVHRDIKGANILVNNDYQIKISDFGISNVCSSSASVGALCTATGKQRFQGSVFWMAPEVIREERDATTKVDIWSLGCVLIEMLSGDRPWAGLDQVQAVYQIGCGHDNPISHFQKSERTRLLVAKTDDAEAGQAGQSIWEAMPWAAQDFIEQCIRHDPDRRPTAFELLNHPFCT